MDDKNSDVLFLLVHDFLPAILKPYSRWVLYKILEAYAGASFEASSKILAIRLGLYERRISVALKELIAHQILIEPTELAESRNFLKLNEELFRRYWQVSTRSRYSIEEWYQRFGSMPNELFFYLYKARLHDFYVSHTQMDRTSLQGKLDFKDALVLLCLVRNTNEFGVIETCGITKLKDKTGLSKPSIFRCIESLKKYGVIRYRLDGVANNRFLNGMHPIFFLNFSHELWLEKRRYGYFYVLDCKSQYTFDIYKNYLYIKYFIENYSDLLHMLERKDLIGITSYIDEQIRSQQCDLLTNSSQYLKKEISNSYDQADQYFLSQLYDLALEIMNSGNGFSHFSYYFEYKTMHSKNRNMNSHMAVMARIQAIFEQWSVQNFGNVPAMKKSENGVIFWNHENFSKVQSLIYSLVDVQDSQKADASFTIHYLQKFIKIFTAMFVKRTVFIFYQAFQMTEMFSPFAIVPHNDPQTICIFQPSRSQSANVFIQIDFDRVDKGLNCKQFIPSLKDLKRIGLLPACCETVDGFE